MGFHLLSRSGVLSVIVGLSVSVASSVQSQERGGLVRDAAGGSLNRIEGHVCYPGGRGLDRQVPVKLRSASGGETSTVTRDDGAFNFAGLKEGRYYVSVDAGPDFDAVNEEIEVLNSTSRRGDGQAVKVQINLRYRSKEIYRASTVDVSYAEIPPSALKLYMNAQKLSQDGEREKAIEQLEKAIFIYPEFANAFNELGLQYLRLRKMEKAEEAFQEALKISPRAFAPRLNYGILLVQVKRYEPGAAILREVTVEDDSSASAHLFLGRALIGLDNYGEAEKQLVKAASLGGNDAIEARRYLGAVYIERHENQRAAQELEAYLQLSPKVRDAQSIRKIIAELRQR